MLKITAVKDSKLRPPPAVLQHGEIDETRASSLIWPIRSIM